MDVYLQEGVNDPGIFKAVFTGGGPGSGKSFVASKLGLHALGLKSINSDPFFVAALKKANLPLKLDLVSGEDIARLRIGAKRLTGKQLELALQGRLGIVIDSTASDVGDIKKEKNMLEKLGYETAMVFVDTSLETALERNQQRARSVPEKVVRDKHKVIRGNLSKLRAVFGKKNYYQIPNDGTLQDLNTEIGKVYGRLSTWIKRKPQSPEAQEWIEQMRQQIRRESVNEMNAKDLERGDSVHINSKGDKYHGKIALVMKNDKGKKAVILQFADKKKMAYKYDKVTPVDRDMFEKEMMVENLDEMKGDKVRHVKKDFKIGKVSFSKGDLIMVGMKAVTNLKAIGGNWELALKPAEKKTVLINSNPVSPDTLSPGTKDLMTRGADRVFKEESEEPEEGDTLSKKDILWKKKVGNKMIVVTSRDTSAMRGTQDKFLMYVTDTKMKVLKDWGSHPSLSGAKGMLARKVNEQVSVGGGAIPTGPESVGVKVDPDGSFGGTPVFNCDDDTFCNCIKGKKKYQRWSAYLGKENEFFNKMQGWMSQSYKNKNFILRNGKTGEMVHARSGLLEGLEDAKTKFTPDMLDTLRKEYAKIRTVDPGGPSYKKLTKLLDKMPKDRLKQLAGANINFVSKLAANRLR